MAAYAFGKGFGGAFGKGVGDSPFNPSLQFDDGISVEEAGKIGGLDFEFTTAPSLFMHNGMLHASGEKTILRADTGEFISTMSQGYKLVQPMEILETHRKFQDAAGYHVRACGTFKNGARFWSMAEAEGELVLAGDDRIKSYLFMASACDGSSATYAIATAMRMACWNMAPAIIRDAKANGRFIRVTHSQTFNADKARIEISANDKNFLHWCDDAKALAAEKFSVKQAIEYFGQVFEVAQDEEDEYARLDEIQENKRVQKCLELFTGQGAGSQLESAKNTLWGAYNAVTEYVDHHANTQSSESRFMNQTMGTGFRVKANAWNMANELI